MTALFSNNSVYPKSVYEDAWEDMELLCENWIALHGVDRTFCKLAMKNFAEHLKVDPQEIKSKRKGDTTKSFKDYVTQLMNKIRINNQHED